MIRPPQNPNSFHEEGVIKFDLSYEPAPPLSPESLIELGAWRQILYGLGLTGRDPTRYQGLAYGNVSLRTGMNRFIVSGTQTGGKTYLSPYDYCLIMDFNLDQNQIHATGPIEPSSEALTHGAIYAANPLVNCVLHVHSPVIWLNAKQLGIQQTEPSIAYGTPEMGKAVGQAVKNINIGLVSMGGHEDGLIAFADTIQKAGIELVSCLAKAKELELLATLNINRNTFQSE